VNVALVFFSTIFQLFLSYEVNKLMNIILMIELLLLSPVMFAVLTRTDNEQQHKYNNSEL